MRRTLAGFLVILMGIAGCASYSPSSAPLPKLDAMATCLIDGPVKIGVDPYVQGDRQKRLFGAEMGSAGIIPIRVFLENVGDGRVLVKSSDIVMVLPDATRINQTGARAACAKMSSSAGVVLATIGFGAIGGIVANDSEQKARVARLEDYQRKEFQEANLGKGDSAHGFLYFIAPPESTKFDSALLQVRVKNMDDLTSAILELPLRDLQYKAPISTRSGEVQTGFNHQ